VGSNSIDANCPKDYAALAAATLNGSGGNGFCHNRGHIPHLQKQPQQKKAEAEESVAIAAKSISALAEAEASSHCSNRIETMNGC